MCLRRKSRIGLWLRAFGCGPLCFSLLVSLEIGLHAATNGQGLETGVHYYAISNLQNTAATVIRGKAGSQGYAHDALILAPNTRYREWILNIASMRVAVSDYTTPSVGQQFSLPAFELRETNSPDTDGDDLHDLAEFILGTSQNNADSDGDGIQDGAEVRDGTDPLDGLPASIGIIAATDTPGTAVDVSALNDIAVVADSAAGVTVLNVVGQNPIRIAEVNTPGTALRVALAGNFLVVADGGAGLAIIDITDPPVARIIHQLNLGSSAQAVAAASGLGYVGLANGEIATVDLASGFAMSRRALGGSVRDLAFSGDHLLVVTSGALLVLNPYDIDLPTLGNIGMSDAVRLVAGNGMAYVTVPDGFTVFAIGSNNSPVLLRQNRPGQTDWRHIVFNGSGLGIAAVNQGFGGTPLDVELYSLPAPDQLPQVVTRINTPGESQAVSIYNGRAYVADGGSGLQVINYLAYDSAKNPPTIALSTSFALDTSTSASVEEAKLVRVTANVTDDVQVRNAEFYVDGARVITDGNFPLEHRFLTPRLTTTKTNFTVRAKATDTGGNFSWSDEIVVELTPDTTPPLLAGTDPGNDTVVTNANAVFAFFNEPMSLVSLRSANFHLVWAGPDWRVGTADDQMVFGAVNTYRDTLNVGVLEFSAGLEMGAYQCILTTNATDAAGNRLTTGQRWTFGVLPTGPEGDDDHDGLSNAQEIQLGSNPFTTDSDGDGWSDFDEFENGTDPGLGASIPPTTIVARPQIRFEVTNPGAATSAVVLARPKLRMEVSMAITLGGPGASIFLARPPIRLDLTGGNASDGSSRELILAKPPVGLKIPTINK